MRNPIHNAIVEINKRQLVSCNRCGCPNLAWITYKSGKHGLVETAVQRPFWRGDGPAPEGLFALKFNFHRCEEYQAQKSEIERRRTECHPKADNPREIISDAISYVVNQYGMEHGYASFGTLPIDHPVVASVLILSDAGMRIQQAH